mmetsp:Transcript_70736/g.207171  ORF Transcript_70736/g.207171 Transcript_70736/m.207171 type:complete len:92 (-) Transcript_70736:1263-1538(-)
MATRHASGKSAPLSEENLPPAAGADGHLRALRQRGGTAGALPATANSGLSPLVALQAVTAATNWLWRGGAVALAACRGHLKFLGLNQMLEG